MWMFLGDLSYYGVVCTYTHTHMHTYHVMIYFGDVHFSLYPLKREKFASIFINKLIEEF